MSASLTYIRDAWLNHMARDTAYAKPTQTWLVLYLTGSVEVSTVGTGYARQRVYLDGTTEPYWTAPGTHSLGGRYVGNNVLIQYDEATDDWGEVVAVGIVDESANLMFKADMTAAETVSTGRIFRFKADAVKWVIGALT